MSRSSSGGTGTGRPRGPYVGRFAPSPTGLLHAGSLVAALGSWLDARAHAGRWLVRIEDVDTPRCQPGADLEILRQLAVCGLVPDEPPSWQSQRGAIYAAALDDLLARGLAYACTCTRSQIAAALAASGRPYRPHGELVYPGTCRPATPTPITTPAVHLSTAPGVTGDGHPMSGAVGSTVAVGTVTDASTQVVAPSAPRHAVRLRVEPGAVSHIGWTDRRLGPQQQDVSADVGDFVLRRADGLWAYQLAVVVDDAAQGVTHIVRGADLADNTARQILLQRQLGLATPSYLHLALVLAADGHKLSKQNGATPLDLADPLAALQAAARALGLPNAAPGASLTDVLAGWTAAWTTCWPMVTKMPGPVATSTPASPDT
ncbi:MAG: tRNA glutamyl-Q(34) synthetase GluQRS [Burkholderiales bacterium]|nr:tRNA glutamyl-Q(34) synthetase GluQRS [Burkholderiales bacterium]